MNRINLTAAKGAAKAHQPKPIFNSSINNNRNLNLVQLKQLKQYSPVQFQQSILALQSTIGNRAVVQLLRQLEPPLSSEAVHQKAAEGVQGSGGRLPHYDKIQSAFGKHDVSQVQAYTGNESAAASRAIGARAYATGNKIAFAESNPDLHTAAHEAAHVIQQRAGVHLKGGVGETGDQYEQQADKVADSVVQGKSAESLLDSQVGSPGNTDGLNAQPLQSQTAVQRAVGFEFETGWLVEKEKSKKSNARVSLTKKEKIITATGYHIEADEAGGGLSELEFVIKPPVEENNTGLEKLKSIMNDILVYGTKLIGSLKEVPANEKNKKEEVKTDEKPKDQAEFSITGDDNKTFYIIPFDQELQAGIQITTGLDLAVITRLDDLNQENEKSNPEAYFKPGVEPRVAGMLSSLKESKGIPEDMSLELKGLLRVIANYLSKGSYIDKPTLDDYPNSYYGEVYNKALDYPKMIGDILLARTQFSKLFTLLPQKEHEKYQKNPEQWVDLVMKASNLKDPDESVIERGVKKSHIDPDELNAAYIRISKEEIRKSKEENTGKEQGETKEMIEKRIDAKIFKGQIDKFKLTRREWLVGITKGKDKLRKMKDAESMGEFKDQTEKVGPKNDKEVGIFEFRGVQGNKIPLKDWPDFAIRFLKFIIIAHGGKIAPEEKAKHEKEKK